MTTPEQDSPGLRPVLGLGGAIWMGLGSILGTGVFVSLALGAELAGSGLVWAVALAAIVAGANGLSSAQLAAAHPVSGGTYEYGHRVLHPVAGFAAGWMFLAAKSASAATAALGCAGYLLGLTGQSASGGLRAILALALVLGLTALVAGGAQRSSRVNAVVVTMTLVALLAFVGVGALSLEAAHLPPRLGAAAMAQAWSSPHALLHATALMFVAYTGYGRIATLGQEVRDPTRTIPRAIVVTLVLTMALYLAVAAVAVGAVGAQAFAASAHQQAAPLELVARAFVWPKVAWVVAAGAVTAMAGVLLNLILGLSRVMMAMACRGELPRGLAQVRQDTGSPTRAVWAVGALVAALVSLGDLKTTWSFSALTVLIYYGITNLAALRLPEQARRGPRALPWLGLISCLGLAFFIEGRIWAVGAGLMAAGLGLRAWMLRAR